MKFDCVKKEELGSSWLEVVRGREFVTAVACDYGYLAGMQVALFTYRDPNDAEDFEFEVASGPGMRSATIHYRGVDESDANEAFLKVVAELAGYTAPE